jgi:branched-chain amino acid transport system ATP-binding protein
MKDVLSVRNLQQHYGGLQVLLNLSFSLGPGERVALIGPNGAGKTTLLNVLTGFTPPAFGQIYLLDKDVTHMPSHKRVSLGLARSFQLNTLFPRLSLLVNVLLAIQGVQSTRYRWFRPIIAHGPNLAKARELLELVGLWEERAFPVAALSYGQQRLVEMILAMASKPKLLLLDEPSAGLSSGESNHLIDMINSLTGDTTVFFSAHDLDLVFSLANRVMVLYYGQIIASGTPEEIQDDPKVREIYLGTKKESADA